MLLKSIRLEFRWLDFAFWNALNTLNSNKYKYFWRLCIKVTVKGIYSMNIKYNNNNDGTKYGKVSMM